MKKIITSAFVVSICLSSPPQAAEQTIDTCISNILKQKSGKIIKLEKLNTSGKPVYEFEIKDANGFEWEFMCDATNGKIFETESEVDSVNSIAFKSKAKFTEQDAALIALKAFPGTIEEVEYEIEENGDASYEFDIVNVKGVETKVEVDATSGKIIESSIEEWEIGEEIEEKR